MRRRSILSSAAFEQFFLGEWPVCQTASYCSCNDECRPYFAGTGMQPSFGMLLLLVSCYANHRRKFTAVGNPTDPSVHWRRATGAYQPKSFHGCTHSRGAARRRPHLRKRPLRRSAGLSHPETTAQSLASSRAGGASYRAELSEHHGSQPNQQQRAGGSGAGEAEQQPINDAAPRRAAEDAATAPLVGLLHSQRVRPRGTDAASSSFKRAASKTTDSRVSCGRRPAQQTIRRRQELRRRISQCLQALRRDHQNL